MRCNRQFGFVLAFIALTAAGAFGAAIAEAKDFRTSFVRLVPETDWKPQKGQELAIEVVNAASHGDSGEFTAAFEKELTEQFGRVLGYAINPKAATRLKFTVAEFDPGNAGLRLGLGMGGKAYVGGNIDVTLGGKAAGELRYSFRPNSPGAGGMARESAAGVALKLSNGDRDAELHPLKAK